MLINDEQHTPYVCWNKHNIQTGGKMTFDNIQTNFKAVVGYYVEFWIYKI